MQKKKLNFKKILPRISMLLLLCIGVVLGIYSILSGLAPRFDDTILGSAYLAAEMPVPTASPLPTEPPATPPVYEAELTSVYNVPDKIAYLTFDDGPSANITPQILDILKEKGVRATFFVLGVNVDKNPDIARRIAEEGHILANHSYSHDYTVLYNGTEQFLEDIKKTEAAIINHVGPESYVKVFRFPGGSYEASKNPQKQALAELGYKFLDWNALNGDAEGQNLPPETLLARLRETTASRRNAVILMHDASTKQTTVDALAACIDHLRAQGFQFKTLQDVPLS